MLSIFALEFAFFSLKLADFHLLSGNRVAWADPDDQALRLRVHDDCDLRLAERKQSNVERSWLLVNAPLLLMLLNRNFFSACRSQVECFRSLNSSLHRKDFQRFRYRLQSSAKHLDFEKQLKCFHRLVLRLGDR